MSAILAVDNNMVLLPTQPANTLTEEGSSLYVEDFSVSSRLLDGCRVFFL